MTLPQYNPNLVPPDAPDSSRGGVGSPEGVKVGSPFQVWFRTDDNTIWVKETGEETDTGWASYGGGGGGGGMATTDIDTSSKIRAIVTDESGTGALLFAGGALGAATATSINGLTITSSTGTFTLTNGKTLSVANTLSFAGTDSTTITFQGTDTYVGRATTDTLTNKRITRRVVALTDAATVTPNSDTTDIGRLATLSQATQLVNPSGTPTAEQVLEITIKSTSSRALTYDTQYKGSDDQPLPASTTGSSKWDRFKFQWNADDSKWELVGKNFGF